MRQRALSLLLSGTAGVVATVGVLAVVAAAFALSFDAIRAVAIAAHITPGLAWLYPVAVDGAMSVATVCAVVLRARGRSAVYPWAVVLFGALVSVVANGLHAWVAGGALALPASWAVLLSAVPPVLLALSVHLLIVLALAVRPTEVPANSGAGPVTLRHTDIDTGRTGLVVREAEPIPTSATSMAPADVESVPVPTDSGTPPGDDVSAARNSRPRTDGEVPDLFASAGLVMPVAAPMSRNGVVR